MLLTKAAQAGLIPFPAKRYREAYSHLLYSYEQHLLPVVLMAHMERKTGLRDLWFDFSSIFCC